MNRIKLYISTALLLVGIGALTLVPAAAASAAAKSSKTSSQSSSASSAQSTVCSTLGSSSDCSTTPAGSVDINSIVAAVINILSIVVGIAAVIMLIVSGFRMITANGDSNSIASARSGIIYALVGVVIAVSAQIIVQFVLNKATS